MGGVAVDNAGGVLAGVVARPVTTFGDVPVQGSALVWKVYDNTYVDPPPLPPPPPPPSPPSPPPSPPPAPLPPPPPLSPPSPGGEEEERGE